MTLPFLSLKSAAESSKESMRERNVSLPIKVTGLTVVNDIKISTHAPEKKEKSVLATKEERYLFILYFVSLCFSGIFMGFLFDIVSDL